MGEFRLRDALKRGRTPVGAIALMWAAGWWISESLDKAEKLSKHLPEVLRFLGSRTAVPVVLVVGLGLIFWQIYDLGKSGREPHKRALRQYFKDALIGLGILLVLVLSASLGTALYAHYSTKPLNTDNKVQTQQPDVAPGTSPEVKPKAMPHTAPSAVAPKPARSSIMKPKAAEASKKATGPVSPQPPSMSQECDGGNCAISVNQQGGITAGQVNVQLADDQRARMSFENIHFVRGTMNIGKVPDAADTPFQKVQPDGTVVVTLPLGFPEQPINVEIKVKNIGELYALDVHWFGGVVLSELLDAAGEDALFDRMKKILIATQPELKPQEVETIAVRKDMRAVDDQNAVMSKKKFPYLVLVGTFHDKFGPPDAEFCGHYGGDDQMFRYDHACARHNQ